MVKEAFVLAEAMRDGTFCLQSIRADTLAKRTEIESMSDAELNGRIRPERRQLFDNTDWKTDTVELEDCMVWPEMGCRSWIKSMLVPSVADTLRRKEHHEDDLWSRIPFASLLDGLLPLIVVRRKSSSAQYRIDDGNHRSVALWITDQKTAQAFVGKVAEERFNHSWKWPTT